MQGYLRQVVDRRVAPVSQQCPKTGYSQPGLAAQLRRSKHSDHCECDAMEHLLTLLSSLGVKWSQVQILSARHAKTGSDQRRSGFCRFSVRSLNRRELAKNLPGVGRRTFDRIALDVI